LALSALALFAEAKEVYLADSLFDEAIRLDLNEKLGRLCGGWAKRCWATTKQQFTTFNAHRG
jgi:hypothetical protein